MNQAVFVLVLCMTSLSLVQCGGGGGGEEKVYFKAQYPHHTIHKHHTQKIPDVKIIKVPVVKEVKVPTPYKVPIKIKVPYLVHQKIHIVKKETHPVHTSEHVHHKPTHHYHHDKSAHSSFDDVSHHFSSHASDLTPMYVSHTPVGHASYDALKHGSGGFLPTEDAYPTFDFHSKLHTSIPKDVGFSSHEGRSLNYEVNETPEDHGALDEHNALSPGKVTKALPKVEPYPYPLTQDEAKTEYLFGFDPMHSSYDFTDL